MGDYRGRYVTSPYDCFHPGHPDYPFRRSGEKPDPMAIAAWERALNKKSKKEEESIIKNEEIREERIEVNDMENQVSVTNWISVASADDNTTMFKEITKEILWPIVQIPIVLSVPHGNEISLPTGQDNFFIFIWASTHRPQGSRESGLLGERILDAPQSIWEIPIDCRTWVFAPSGKGIIIYDGEYAVAELVGNNLFIHHDICHCGTENELKIFRRILEEVAKILPEIKEQQKQADEKRKADELTKTREHYIELCVPRIEGDIVNLKKSIASSKESVEQCQKKIVQELRRIAENQKKLEFFESNLGGAREQFSQEFDKLISLDKVKEVKLSHNRLDVYTDTLFCANPKDDKVYEIGKFCIEIYTDCRDNGIRLVNQTRIINQCQAPHVDSSGKPCLGNMAEVIPELIAHYEYSMVAMLAIQFIESYNPDDGGYCNIYNWPLAKGE